METTMKAVVLLVIFDAAYCRDLRVGAFNIQIFGKTKANKPDIMDYLVKIIQRYDILLIQEIRDKTDFALKELLRQLNENVEWQEQYSVVRSGRLGRTHAKEEYAYLYRSGVGIQVDQHYVFEDGEEDQGDDLFEREPFIAAFTSTNTVLEKFVLVGIHVDPDVAVQEINHLYDVFSDAKSSLNINDVMVLGDLNADCGYVRKNKWSNIPLKHDPSFDWLIKDGTDTTVTNTHCAFDRFITTGDGWSYGIVPDSVAVYRFDEDPYLGPIDKTVAVKISDHYPIEFLLAGKSSRYMDEF